MLKRTPPAPHLTWLGPSGVYNSHSCPHWAPAIYQFQFSFSVVPTLALVSTHVSPLQYGVAPCIHLLISPVLGAAVYSVSSPLFQIQEELIFQSIHLFTCYLDGVLTTKLLTHRTGVHPEYSFFNGKRHVFSSTLNSLAKQAIWC